MGFFISSLQITFESSFNTETYLLYSVNVKKKKTLENFWGMFNNSRISQWATFELWEQRPGEETHALWLGKQHLQSNSTKPRLLSNDSFEFSDI